MLPLKLAIGVAAPTPTSWTVSADVVMGVLCIESMAPPAMRLTTRPMSAVPNTVSLIVGIRPYLKVGWAVARRITLAVANLLAGAVAHECRVDEPVNKCSGVLSVTPQSDRSVALFRDQWGYQTPRVDESSTAIADLARDRSDVAFVGDFITGKPSDGQPRLHSDSLPGGGRLAV